MGRVVLIHWNEAEGRAREAELCALGFEAAWCAPDGGQGLQPFRAGPPDAFVIDLTRLPSHGRAVGLALRQYKTTRAAPLIFAGGDTEKVRQTRGLLPDATYTEWPEMGAALRRALQAAPAKLVVPHTMAGYSGTPLPKKLGIKAGATVALLGAPEGFERKLGVLPAGVRLTTRGAASTALLFVKSRAALQKRFPTPARSLAEGGALWVVWPKKTSALAGDLGEKEVREFGLASGWVDYKICAVDETWSGLCFARRVKGKAATR